MSNKWLSGLKHPVPAESVRSIWFSVDVVNGGVVCCPKCDLKLFYNIYDDE